MPWPDLAPAYSEPIQFQHSASACPNWRALYRFSAIIPEGRFVTTAPTLPSVNNPRNNFVSFDRDFHNRVCFMDIPKAKLSVRVVEDYFSISLSCPYTGGEYWEVNCPFYALFTPSLLGGLKELIYQEVGRELPPTYSKVYIEYTAGKIEEQMSHHLFAGVDLKNKWVKKLVSRFPQLLLESKKKEQVIKDGLINILPYVVIFEKTPEELKELFGRGIWRRLCKKHLNYNIHLAGRFTTEGCFTRFKSLCRNKLLSYKEVLMVPNFESDEVERFIAWVRKNKIRTCPPKSCRVFIEWGDLSRMLPYLGRKPKERNKLKSLEGLHSFHNEVVEKYNIKKAMEKDTLREKKFPLIGSLTKPIEFEGYTFTRLNSGAELLAEGTAMHHCVGNGSYMEKGLSGTSIFLKVEGPERATVELFKTLPSLGNNRGGGVFTLSQAYTYNDEYVSEATNKAIRTFIDNFNLFLNTPHRTVPREEDYVIPTI